MGAIGDLDEPRARIPVYDEALEDDNGLGQLERADVRHAVPAARLDRLLTQRVLLGLLREKKVVGPLGAGGELGALGEVAAHSLGLRWGEADAVDLLHDRAHVLLFLLNRPLVVAVVEH